MARPLKEIDGEQVFKLARLGCTQEEIGEFFGVDHRTIGNRFSQEFQLGKASGKTSIRRWQMKKAKSGCTTMLIHLGKTYLGQTDKIETTHKGTLTIDGLDDELDGWAEQRIRARAAKTADSTPEPSGLCSPDQPGEMALEASP